MEITPLKGYLLALSTGRAHGQSLIFVLRRQQELLYLAPPIVHGLWRIKKCRATSSKDDLQIYFEALVPPPLQAAKIKSQNHSD